MLRESFRVLQYVDVIDPNDCHREELLDGSLLARLRTISKPNGAVLILEQIAEIVKAKSLLRQLACDRHPEVRAAVADNPHTPNVLKCSLACDDHADVRFRVAENAHSPLAALMMLAEDDNPYIAFRAKKTIDRMSSYQPTVIAFPNRAANQEKGPPNVTGRGS
jgi:hypothetical protein